MVLGKSPPTLYIPISFVSLSAEAGSTQRTSAMKFTRAGLSAFTLCRLRQRVMTLAYVAAYFSCVSRWNRTPNRPGEGIGLAVGQIRQQAEDAHQRHGVGFGQDEPALLDLVGVVFGVQLFADGVGDFLGRRVMDDEFLDDGPRTHLRFCRTGRRRGG